jgi:hypothetical protein
VKEQEMPENSQRVILETEVEREGQVLLENVRVVEDLAEFEKWWLAKSGELSSSAVKLPVKLNQQLQELEGKFGMTLLKIEREDDAKV